MIDGAADRYSESDSGCTCGLVLNHLSVRMTFARNPEDSSLLVAHQARGPAGETRTGNGWLSCRYSLAP